MIPPEPPRLAGPKGKGRQSPSSDSLLCPEPAGRKSRHTGEPPQPQCERVLTDPLTQADCFPPARKTVIKEGIKKIWVYTRQYSYNMIFLVFMSSCIPRPSTTTARLRWTHCTGRGTCTTRALLTPRVNRGCLCPAARPDLALARVPQTPVCAGHTVQSAGLARRAWRLTPEVNSGYLCPAARPLESGRGPRGVDTRPSFANRSRIRR